MELSVRAEVTLRDGGDGRTSAAIWGISRPLLGRLSRAVPRFRPVILFDYSATRDLADEVLPRLKDATIIGSKSKAAMLTTSSDVHDVLDALARSERGLWGFDVAVLERAPTQDELIGMKDGVQLVVDIPTPLAFSISHRDGGTWLDGPTAQVEVMALGALMERILGRPSEHELPGTLATIARERGLLLFRDLVERGETTRAVLLHACGWCGVVPAIPRTSRRGPVMATEVTIGPGGVILRDLEGHPAHEWLAVGRVRLALARGSLRSGDEGWV